MNRIGVLDDGRILYAQDPAPAAPIALGLHLFLDDGLVDTNTTLWRLAPAVRDRTTPVLVGDYYTYGSVVYDPLTGIYRLWYSSKSPSAVIACWTRTSFDGVSWSTPVPVTGFTQIGPVLDEGIPSAERYKVVVVHMTPSWPRWPGDLYTSSDGITWNASPANPVQTMPCGECWSLFRDGNSYRIMHRLNKTQDPPYSWTDKQGVLHAPALTRCIATSKSITGLSYPPSDLIFSPNSGDDGETQFYSVSNIVRRGEFFVGLLHVYRDDLVASGAPLGFRGIGYTAVIWSRDGVGWWRTPQHYLNPIPTEGWDHATAFIFGLAVVGEEMHLFYHGTNFGHVGGGRGLGLIKVKRDRFVSRYATDTPRVLRTKPITLPTDFRALSLNAKGKIRVQILDAAGVPWSGFAYADHSSTNTTDQVNRPAFFTDSLSSLAGKTVRLEFELTRADLFGFNLE